MAILQLTVYYAITYSHASALEGKVEKADKRHMYVNTYSINDPNERFGFVID